MLQHDAVDKILSRLEQERIPIIIKKDPSKIIDKWKFKYIKKIYKKSSPNQEIAMDRGLEQRPLKKRVA